MPSLYFIFFIISGLPIICYPMILMANFMSLAGHRPKGISTITILMMKSFLVLTTLYPVTYFFALYKYRNTDPETHFIWVGVILLHWLLVVLVFKGWIMTENKKYVND